MRILIAEDELIERKAMRKFIENNFTDFTVVGEAVNGRQAIELVETTEPDIIFMDIKMPGINGLEAIAEINEKYPAIKFILVSAYDSFDYAKEAMQFGIKDYILKPGKKEEIVKALLRLQQEITSERKAKKQSTALLQEQFMRHVMHEPLPEDTFYLQEELFPRMKSGCFFVMKSDEVYQLENVKKVVEYPYLLQQREHMTVMCMIAPVKLEKADTLKVARKLSIAFDEKMYIGIGFPTESLKKFPASYQAAYSACLQLAAEQKNHYGFKQTEDKQHTTFIAQLRSFVEKGQADEATHYFKENGTRLTESELEDIYIMIKNILTARDIGLSSKSFTSLKTHDDWYNYLHLSCMKIKTFYQSKQYTSQAKHYMQAHFNEAITLEDVADAVNLSSNYFSNLFKQEFGETFIDYLTKIRLEKAKELLEKNELSLKEISFMVGYKDPNYFSRVFKKHYRESPKHFQQAIFKK